MWSLNQCRAHERGWPWDLRRGMLCYGCEWGEEKEMHGMTFIGTLASTVMETRSPHCNTQRFWSWLIQRTHAWNQGITRAKGGTPAPWVRSHPQELLPGHAFRLDVHACSRLWEIMVSYFYLFRSKDEWASCMASKLIKEYLSYHFHMIWVKIHVISKNQFLFIEGNKVI